MNAHTLLNVVNSHEYPKNIHLIVITIYKLDECTSINWVLS